MLETIPTSQKPSSEGPKAPNPRSVILLGLLPLVVYWIVEHFYGIKAGVLASLVFGAGEIVYEKKTEGSISSVTILSNSLIVILGGISLFLNEGIFIKLQPMILELVFSGVIIGSSLTGTPFMVMMMQKNKMKMSGSRVFEKYMKGLNLRLGIAMFIHALIIGLSAWKFSTDVWIFVKGVLFFILFGIMMLGEFIYSKKILSQKLMEERLHRLKSGSYF